MSTIQTSNTIIGVSCDQKIVTNGRWQSHLVRKRQFLPLIHYSFHFVFVRAARNLIKDQGALYTERVIVGFKEPIIFGATVEREKKRKWKCVNYKNCRLLTKWKCQFGPRKLFDYVTVPFSLSKACAVPIFVFYFTPFLRRRSLLGTFCIGLRSLFELVLSLCSFYESILHWLGVVVWFARCCAAILGI